MQIVGDKLAEIARSSSNKVEIDLFGRSAFNRYYYSAFLTVRTALRRIDSKWETPNHSDVPAMLKGKVLKKLKDEIKKSVDKHLIHAGEGNRMCVTGNSAINALNIMLIEAREVRRIADYDPEISLGDTGGSLKLGGTKLSAAAYWESQAEIHVRTLLRIYEDLGII